MELVLACFGLLYSLVSTLHTSMRNLPVLMVVKTEVRRVLTVGGHVHVFVPCRCHSLKQSGLEALEFAKGSTMQ